MESYVKSLLNRLENELQKIDPEGSALRRHEKIIKLTQASIRDIKKYHSKHPFRSKAVEIHYFKKEAPYFFEKLFFSTKAMKLELFRFSTEREVFVSYMQTELKNIHFFFQHHGDLIQYFLVDGDYMDEKVFTHSELEDWGIDPLAVTDSLFCVGSYLMAWMRANEEYRALLEREIRQSLHGPKEGADGRVRKHYGFKGSGADAAEIIDSWDRLQVITVNGTRATLKEIKEMWEAVFEMNMGNISEKKRLNHARKKEKTPFLNRMIRVLLGEDIGEHH